MERRIIRRKESEIDSMKLPPNGNMVIIEITERSKDKVTKGGIYVGFNEDVIYAEGDGSHAADVAEVWGVVHRAPASLYYKEKDNNSMPWETTVQIQEGDMVWFDYFESVNCDVLLYGDRVFYVIPYRDLYVAKRGKEIIPLNGYCLCEPIEVEHKSKFAVNIGDKYRHDRVVVRYLAEPNKRYQPNDAIYGTYNNDDIGLVEGDIVLLRQRCPLILLERLDTIATFSEQPYFVIQRRNMQIVV